MTNSLTKTDRGDLEPQSSQTRTGNTVTIAGYWRHLLGTPLRATTDAVCSAIQNMPVEMRAFQPISAADQQILRLHQLKGASDGWAGPGSKSPSHSSIEAAIVLIQRMRHLPFPCPSASIGAHGNAGLSWSDSKIYADVELFEDGRAGFLVHVTGGAAVDDEDDIPPNGLPKALGKALAEAYFSNRT